MAVTRTVGKISQDEKASQALQKAIPKIIRNYAAYTYPGFVIGAGFTYYCAKSMKVKTLHGSAAFATAKKIDEPSLGVYEDKPVTRKGNFFESNIRRKSAEQKSQA